MTSRITVEHPAAPEPSPNGSPTEPGHDSGKSVPLAKIVVAGQAPWLGEVYHLRAGHSRLGFNTVESFCAAIMSATDWQLHMPPDAEGVVLPSAGSVRDLSKRQLAVLHPRDSATAQRAKFIVATYGAWFGEMYRTRPGLPHVRFASFDEFMQSTLAVTGWSIPAASPATVLGY